MAKKKSGTLGSLNSYGNEFEGRIAGVVMHCKALGKGKKRKLRCVEMKGGPGSMSKPARKRAGVKSLNKERSTVPVAKSKAIRKSGKGKGTPFKGCRRKGGKVLCTPTVAKRLKAKKAPKKRATKRRAAKKPMSAARRRAAGYGAATALTRKAKKRRR